MKKFRRRPQWRRYDKAIIATMLVLVISLSALGLGMTGVFLNVPWPTRGGQQLWGDVFISGAWRIQRNVVTGHHRLLDGNDVRRAWGTYEESLKAFGPRRVEVDARFGSSHIVLLLHGLGRHRKSMERLRVELREVGFEAVSIGYPSTRAGIDVHAAQIEEILNRLEGVETVSFVTHSLGGIVVRQVLSGEAAWRHSMSVGGLAMMGPPNQGAVLASLLKDNGAFSLIAGSSGQELANGSLEEIAGIEDRYCIIAGGRGDGRGYNPLIEGDDDGVVAVKEARLKQGEDFILVPSIHTLIMDHPMAVDAVSRFLSGGLCAG